MVLAVMVAILVFRVYQVLNPPPIITGPTFQIPGNDPPEGIGPGIPPPPPAPELTDDWSRLWRRPIHTWHAQRGRGNTGDNRNEQERLDISVVDLREAGGIWRARIRTQSRTSWKDVGEQFEQYTLMAIDSERKCVTIFSDRDQKNIEICMPPPSTP